jgi:hypothetical protein
LDWRWLACGVFAGIAAALVVVRPRRRVSGGVRLGAGQIDADGVAFRQLQRTDPGNHAGAEQQTCASSETAIMMISVSFGCG